MLFDVSFFGFKGGRAQGDVCFFLGGVLGFDWMALRWFCNRSPLFSACFEGSVVTTFSTFWFLCFLLFLCLLPFVV